MIFLQGSYWPVCASQPCKRGVSMDNVLLEAPTISTLQSLARTHTTPFTSTPTAAGVYLDTNTTLLDMAVTQNAAIQMFRHQPLDHALRSIRLIEIQPHLSADSILQCTMRHATIDAEYICLSYRWGDPPATRQILVNGQGFMIRQNLFDFLTMIRETRPRLPYWIDAASIDQTNVAERNHQVAQMGNIFSCAQSVHIWLGSAQRLVPVLKILHDPEAASSGDWFLVRSKQNADALTTYICHNEYWNRAWVIQEIFLAKTVMVWADSITLAFDTLHWTIDYFYISWKDTPIAQFKLFTTAIPQAQTQSTTFSEAKKLYHGASLLTLLANFSSKSCEQPRDRVFSLLSMCGEGRDIHVDYSTSDEEVALNVLQCCDKWRCACVPLIVSRCLNLRKNSEAPGVPKEAGLYLTIPISGLTVHRTRTCRNTTAIDVRRNTSLCAYFTWLKGEEREDPSTPQLPLTLDEPIKYLTSAPLDTITNLRRGLNRYKATYYTESVQIDEARALKRTLSLDSHGPRTFSSNGRYFEVCDIDSSRASGKCDAGDLLISRLVNLKYATEVSRTWYQWTKDRECVGTFTEEVLQQLLAGRPLCVQETASAGGTPTFALPTGLHLEPEGSEPWTLRISLWALRETMEHLRKWCNWNKDSSQTSDVPETGNVGHMILCTDSVFSPSEDVPTSCEPNVLH